ncbi:hypothetical protein [Mesorhizobium retamae]|uniref:Uncharacterized protein n=1 Tax=Mesorhizobium retamae TaxID=2912854 RepID=A0ABS9QAG8_9HYPH|nr:hypothetical protein [Mesorhizobium sp. IRAMC:0171]MCG7504406.1 hypothetical protein [Mesorhizobium sp. IRAMC:0171]
MLLPLRRRSFPLIVELQSRSARADVAVLFAGLHHHGRISRLKSSDISAMLIEQPFKIWNKNPCFPAD